MYDIKYRIDDTTLGIVSANDYNKNIFGLGIVSNSGIVKDLKGTDAPSFRNILNLIKWHSRMQIPPSSTTPSMLLSKCQQALVHMDDLRKDDLPKEEVPMDDLPKEEVPSWKSTRT
ncbi:hypothetical protein BG003_005011 [Podila horticola]|nr:hypothetical protein BG003_005011 [Podila horticola]